MKLRKLFLEHFAPCVERFLSGYANRDSPVNKDLKHGSDLAGILLNFPDYAFREDPRPPALLPYASAREYREKQCWVAEPAYELACDFANSWKHRFVTREGAKFRGMTRVRDGFGLCRYRDDKGEYYRSVKLVLLEHVDGHLVDLRRVLVASSQFWNNELVALGLVEPLPPQIFAYSELVHRDDAQYHGPLLTHATNGEVDWSLHAHCLEYDYIANHLVSPNVPCDFKATVDIRVAVHRSPLSPLPRPKELKRLEVSISADLSRENNTGPHVAVTPNPSLKRSANGRPPGPGRRYASPKNGARSCNNTSCLANLLPREEELLFNSVAAIPPVPKAFALIYFNK